MKEEISLCECGSLNSAMYPKTTTVLMWLGSLAATFVLVAWALTNNHIHHAYAAKDEVVYLKEAYMNVQTKLDQILIELKDQRDRIITLQARVDYGQPSRNNP